MCMITFAPAGIVPGTEAFESIAKRTDSAHWINDDGHGFMIATPDGVWSGRGMSYDITFGRYEAALKIARGLYGSVPSAFHSRIGTAGPNDITLCHPFTLGDTGTRDLGKEAGVVRVSTTALMHNGILPNQYQPPLTNRKDSDTSLYVRRLLPHLINPMTGVPGRKRSKSIASAIGTGNKFVIFGSVDGKVTVRMINQDSGKWEDDGAWYSSQYYSGMSSSRYSWTGYSGPRDEDPPASMQGEGEAPEFLTRSMVYRGWGIVPGRINQPNSYYRMPEGVDAESILKTKCDEWLKDVTKPGEVWERCNGTMGSQNYCSRCGTCGDCAQSVPECSCLPESRKPEYAWEAWSERWADDVLDASK